LEEKFLKLVVDTHTHTISSGHAYSTIIENAREASLNGIEAIAMTDHGPSMMGASSIVHFWNLGVIPERLYGVRIVKGVEANIIDYAGKLDVPEDVLVKLEFVLASFHDLTIEPSSLEEHTSALVAVIKNPFVDAIAHPGNPMFPVDIERVVSTAKQYGKLIEINNQSFKVRKGCDANCREFVRQCVKQGARMTCGSDAHICFDIGNFNRISEILKEENVPEELIINTSAEKFERYLKDRSRVNI
jgi:putative hydrolase